MHNQEDWDVYFELEQAREDRDNRPCPNGSCGADDCPYCMPEEDEGEDEGCGFQVVGKGGEVL